MRTVTVFGLIACILLAGGSMAVGDMIQLDQSNHGPTGGGGCYFTSQSMLFQSLQCGLSGWLVRVDLRLTRSVTATDPITVSIYPDSGDGVASHPGNYPANSLSLPAPLATVEIPAAGIPWAALPNGYPYTTVDLSSTPILVHPGTGLAIVLSTTSSSQYYWVADTTTFNAYPRGVTAALWTDRFASQAYDLQFQTYVDVPEPATASLLAAGALMALARRNRGSKSSSARPPRSRE